MLSYIQKANEGDKIKYTEKYFINSKIEKKEQRNKKIGNANKKEIAKWLTKYINIDNYIKYKWTIHFKMKAEIVKLNKKARSSLCQSIRDAFKYKHSNSLKVNGQKKIQQLNSNT